MNGEAVAKLIAKPVVLVVFCSDGKLEVQELAAFADVRAYPDAYDLSLIPDDVAAATTFAIVGMNSPVDRQFIDRCPKLRVVVVLGSAYDNIDISYAGQMGIVVSNTPDLCIEEVADSAFSFILSFYRQTSFLHAAIQSGKHLLKHEDVFSGAKATRRIRGKTLGLLGLGKTGIALAQRAKAFGLNVIFYDPSTADGLEKAIGGLERVSLIADLLTRSDCISLHCSLSEESKHIINDNTLRLFKRGSFLVNVTHSLLVDEVSLAKVLNSGKLGGAALDVCGITPCMEGALKGCPNLICTPHVAWYSRESYIEVRAAAIRLVRQALTSLDGLSMHNCVNGQQLDVNLCRLRWTQTS
jgi:C-terminal binding protein